MSQPRPCTPRPVNDSRKDFFAWLGRFARAGHHSVDARNAIKEVQLHLERAESGLFGVSCFCGKPAVFQTMVSSAPSAEYVALCSAHEKEARAAKDALLSLSNACYEASHPKES